ncbi:MAG: hypothetical protein ACLTDF_08185 [Coprococcus sp.]
MYYFSDANGRCSKLTKIVVGDVGMNLTVGEDASRQLISWDLMNG